MEKHSGIILKNYFPQKNKLILLDDQLGRIDAVAPIHTLPGSALIEYWPRVKGSIYLLEQVNLIDVPLDLARQDILFLHHVLELCYFCLSPSNAVPELFNMIQLLYGRTIIFTDYFKLAFIFKLLAQAGIYPEAPQFHEAYFYHLALESIDTIADKSLDLKMRRTLGEWVDASIAGHPLIHHFKTRHFFGK